MNKKYGKSLSGTVTALCLLASATGTTLFAFAEDGKEIESVSYHAFEAIVAGEVADLQAEVTFTDGSTEMRPIRYTTFPVNEMHNLFHSFHAEGYVEGFDEVIQQNILVVPDNLEYLINLASNQNGVDYEATGEGVIGLELDHTGEASKDEGYFAAVKRKFPELRNSYGAKQYGVNAEEGGDWGYVGDQLVSYKMTSNIDERDLFGHVAFPKRGTTDISVRFTLPAEEDGYDVYFGFYSYWFARSIDILWNGNVIEEDYSIMPSNQTYRYGNVTLSGENTVTFHGAALYEEALTSFVCVAKADTNEYPTVSAPSAPEILQLSDTEMPVTNLTPGTKLQVYNYDTLTLLYEHEIGSDQTEYTVPLNELDLDGVTRLGVCGSNAGGMGETALVQRTDITRFDVSYATDYVGESLRLDLSASAYSDIVSLEMYDGAGNLLIQRETQPSTEWSDSLYVQENGDYRIQLMSARGGKSVKDFTISNIDNRVPELTALFNMKTAKASTATSLTLALSATSISPIVESGYILNGTEKEVDFSAGDVSLTQSGSYTFYLVNELGKADALKVRLSMSKGEAVTAEISENDQSRFTEMHFAGKNGFKVVSVNVYANIDGLTEKMIVNGSQDAFYFNVYDEGVYFAEIVTEDGVREFVVIDATQESGQTAEQGCGGVLTGTQATIGVAAVAVGAAVCMAAKKRKHG